MGTDCIPVRQTGASNWHDQRETNQERLPLGVHKDHAGQAEPQPDVIRALHRGNRVHRKGSGGLHEGEQTGSHAGTYRFPGLAAMIIPLIGASRGGRRNIMVEIRSINFIEML